MKKLTNTTALDIFISDTGTTLTASSDYIIPTTEYASWANSNDIISYIASGDVTVTDGTNILTIAQSVGLLQSNAIQTDFIEALKNNDRLKVEVEFSQDQLIKVSPDDQTAGYLEVKVLGKAGEATVETVNPGSNENLAIGLVSVGTAGTKGSASNVPVFVTDAKGRVTSSTNTPISGVPAANIVNTPAGNIASTNVQTALNELDSEKQAISEKAQANGYASLDIAGKVPLSQLPDTIIGSVDFQGTWNANTNTPNLVTASPSKGDYYVVSVDGSTSLGGITDWKANDWAIYNGTSWGKVDNTDQVSSVFGRQGIITATNGDYTASQITNVPAGTISATTVQAALNELDVEKVPTTRTVSAGTGLTGGGDLSANRTISMPNVGSAGSYGSSSQIPVITTDAQGRVSGVSPTTVDKLYDHWHGTTQYNGSQLRRYTNAVATDANGRITVYLTQNGLVGGTALFTSILNIKCTGVDGSGTAIQAPLFIVESISGVTLVLRAVRGTSTGVLLGGTIISMQFVGSGYTGYLEVVGVKP